MNRMKSIIALLCLGMAVLSCKSEPTQKPAPIEKQIIKTEIVEYNGVKLRMDFNEVKESVTVLFQEDTVELFDQHPASGIWYKNDSYELRGKGKEVQLSKEGEVIFSNE